MTPPDMSLGRDTLAFAVDTGGGLAPISIVQPALSRWDASRVVLGSQVGAHNKLTAYMLANKAFAQLAIALAGRLPGDTGEGRAQNLLHLYPILIPHLRGLP